MELRHVLEATSIVLVIEWKWDMRSRRGTKEKPRLWGLNQWAGECMEKEGQIQELSWDISAVIK